MQSDSHMLVRFVKVLFMPMLILSGIWVSVLVQLITTKGIKKVTSGI